MPQKHSKKDKNTTISCDIVEKFGYLNDHENKIFAKVSWSDREPKYDIRKCYINTESGELMLGAGISLTEDEMEMLVSLYQTSKKREVKLDDVFQSASGIIEKRGKGYRTEDGFIRLHRKQK